ncbi:MAG: hypothetical protein EKK55_16865 [Rhodocyclaceae bacterium]|nr:MAG: hypothetical protein EKK55_16865 [Rhodocyclaceae bacterium]
MTPEDFRDLVRRMRAAQREYFRARDRAVLAEAQRLEREVDAELRPPAQGSLFDGSDADSARPPQASARPP